MILYYSIFAFEMPSTLHSTYYITRLLQSTSLPLTEFSTAQRYV